MKIHIWLGDLEYDKWQFPEGIVSADEKARFIMELPYQGSLLDNGDCQSLKDYRIHKGQPIPFEMVDNLRVKAFRKMKENLAIWLV